jgi:site-specific DNA recombinase
MSMRTPATPTATVIHAYGYSRVSTFKQKVLGVSLDAQTAKIAAMATIQDATLAETIEDDESAKDLNRPGMQRLLSLIEGGHCQVVIVAKLDRLTRSVRDLCYLLTYFEKHSVALVSLSEALDTSSAAGRMFIKLMTVISEWEREIIGERTAAALQFKRASGHVYSRTPYGYDADGPRPQPIDGAPSAPWRLVPNVAEQAVIARVRQYRADGWSLRKIAQQLNDEGIASKNGRQWSAVTVSDVCRRSLAA